MLSGQRCATFFDKATPCTITWQHHRSSYYIILYTLYLLDYPASPERCFTIFIRSNTTNFNGIYFYLLILYSILINMYPNRYNYKNQHFKQNKIFSTSNQKVKKVFIQPRALNCFDP